MQHTALLATGQGLLPWKWRTLALDSAMRKERSHHGLLDLIPMSGDAPV